MATSNLTHMHSSLAEKPEFLRFMFVGSATHIVASLAAKRATPAINLAFVTESQGVEETASDLRDHN